MKIYPSPTQLKKGKGYSGKKYHICSVKELSPVLSFFSAEGTPESVSVIGSGHINDSYLVTTTPDAAPDYVLQRINHQIFKNIPGLMNNIDVVTRHMREGRNMLVEPGDGMQVLELVPTKEGNLYQRDRQGNFWRLYHHIPGSHSFDRVPGPGFAYEGGRAFGNFLRLTTGVDPTSLAMTIPRFHDITWRLEQFEDAIQHDIAGHVSGIPDEIRFVRERAQEMHTIQRLMDSGQLPVRVTHNDTKFNNILFDRENRAVCIVDLDTVMPGTVLYDFGDAIRTGANTASEDEPDLDKVDLDLDLFEAYAKGFLDAAGSSLTPVEVDHLAFSAKFMTFLIGLRFLTDYINGDTYYKIHHPGHNLQRARAQFRLLENMESKFDRMREIVCETAKL